MPRTIWIPAHQRRLPDRIHTPPHEELQAAFIQDIRNDPKKLESALAKEIDRELEIR
ncbi:hypothetical protein [Mesorhizobium caraganae]|uniref:hypothetical protein n=1 Tax=Mesorhizobium caraganae TaxID=483206 RepID=UPI00177D97B4|nr:hypothetical protein [Mesorhizobium caraganae]